MFKGVKFFERSIYPRIFGRYHWVVSAECLFTQSMFWIFHVTKFQFLDYASTVLFFHKPKGLFQWLFAESLVLLFSGTLGIGFALLIREIFSPNILLKGFIFGEFTWTIIYVLTTLFKIKGIYQVIDPSTTLVNFIAASIWGIVMAWGLLFLNRKNGVKN